MNTTCRVITFVALLLGLPLSAGANVAATVIVCAYLDGVAFGAAFLSVVALVGEAFCGAALVWPQEPRPDIFGLYPEPRPRDNLRFAWSSLGVMTARAAIAWTGILLWARGVHARWTAFLCVGSFIATSLAFVIPSAMVALGAWLAFASISCLFRTVFPRSPTPAVAPQPPSVSMPKEDGENAQEAL